MKEKKKQLIKREEKIIKTLSPAKKRIYVLITISLPVFFFLFLEAGLRVFNYSGNLDLFIDGPVGYEEYIRCNPEVARRYFYVQSVIPTPPKQLFLKNKPSNGYRIFVLGESSAAGFPYGNNASFPNILERGLANTFPDKKIEVINVAMSAISSYTLLDFMDEILEQSPDAILIYTGHNEYYGALGVGSEQSLGNSRWLIHTYLKFQSVKTFLLMRDFIGWIKIQFSKIFYKGSEVDPSATLMEKIVAEQTITYNSSLYNAGKEQFEENMNEILAKAKEKGVNVILSELVSNISDQEPFISVEDDKKYSAKTFYELGKKFEAEEDFVKAKQNFLKAKDYDALRFRASEEFNTIQKKLAKKYSIPLVPVISYFEKQSPNGLIGNNLMLEHLHPNREGYFLLAKAFYETMKENNFISSIWSPEKISAEFNNGFTELDSVYAALTVQHLKGGWPFKSKSVPNRFMEVFSPRNKVEEIAFRVMKGGNYSLEVGHMELGKFYEQKGDLDKAFLEYNALIASIPHELEFYERAANVLLKQKKYDRAYKLLTASLKYKENSFANKWIGQISLVNENYKDAVTYLLKSDLNDSQVLFNLARAYYFDNQWENGDRHFKRLRELSPRSEYTAYLTKLRTTAFIKRTAESSKK